MAKRRTHSNKNQSHKDHKNGVKRARSQRFVSLKKIYPKTRRNLHHTLIHNQKHRRAILAKVAAAATPVSA